MHRCSGSALICAIVYESTQPLTVLQIQSIAYEIDREIARTQDFQLTEYSYSKSVSGPHSNELKSDIEALVIDPRLKPWA